MITSTIGFNFTFIASWMATTVLDTLLFVLTFRKTFRIHREHRRIGVQSRLVELLLRDGEHSQVGTRTR